MYRPLVRAGMQGMVAGEIAATLDVPPTNLSRARIEACLALPLYELRHDRAKLKAELDRIGALSA